MLRIEDALDIILRHTPTLDEEEVRLARAVGRVLRRDCVSDLDLPPFDRARMDGYALRAAETEAPLLNAPSDCARSARRRRGALSMVVSARAKRCG